MGDNMYTKLFLLVCLLTCGLTAFAEHPDVAGVVVFDAKVTVEKAAEIGKLLATEDQNFTRVTAFGWAADKEGGKNASALMFNYTKTNDKFVEGKQLGKAIKKKVEAKYGDILRAWHISEGVAEVK